ncbi:MAG: DUF3696 domain-containing protein [Chloroflexi bacterium]|nr:DUF3696 domain-containing protein [Chloroflexota bacterium]
MIESMRIQGFKSWKDTGEVALKPLTGFFGTNSSGKTSLLQFLLMLKQTAELSDRSRVLHMGDSRTYVDLGTTHDIIHNHKYPSNIDFDLTWKPSTPWKLPPAKANDPSEDFDSLAFQAQIRVEDGLPLRVQEMGYQVGSFRFRMADTFIKKSKNAPLPGEVYQVTDEKYGLKRIQGGPPKIPAPYKFYGFPDQANASFQNGGVLAELALALEEQLSNVFYLGPLREYPSRHYVWSGERPQDVGRRGELAVAALLASQQAKTILKPNYVQAKYSVAEHVAWWLTQLGVLHSFKLQPIAPNQRTYEVRIQRTKQSADVPITDVGFGVSQILPVLTLCFYAPEHSTIILEQPEIHLHPAVQAGLADVLIDAIQRRHVQIILESHSEHLLRRLQRRIAEGVLDSSKASLYFAEHEAGQSKLTTLQLDTFGNILNWPENFFGDEMGDLIAMTEAAIKRQMEEGA